MTQGYLVADIILCYIEKCIITANRNLIYTAITRAKEMVVIIGRRSDLNAAIMTKSDVQRNTLLKERIFNNALAMKPKSSRKFA